MKITAAILAFALVHHVQAQDAAVETFECLDDGVVVTDKASCDTWCGGVGAWEMSIMDNQATSIKCECKDKNDVNAPPATKMCEDDVNWLDCTDDDIKVTDPATCDTWCGVTGAYTGFSIGDQQLGLTCECTDKNDPSAQPAVIKCTEGDTNASSVVVATSFLGSFVLAVIINIAAIAF